MYVGAGLKVRLNSLGEGNLEGIMTLLNKQFIGDTL